MTDNNSNGYNTSNNNITDLVKQITIHYIKYYYQTFEQNYRINTGNKLVPENELREFIDEMYEKKQLDLKKYIRTTLKENLKENYSTMATENILLDMFKDPTYAKERVIQEILNEQDD